MCEELTCLCRSMCERRKSRSGSWQLLCAPSLRWQMCHIVRAATCLAAANRFNHSSVCHFLFLSLCSFLSVWLLRPLIHQFAIASNIPISRQTQKQLNCLLRLKKSEYKNIGEAIRRLDSVKCVERRSSFTCGRQLKWPDCLAVTVPECTASQSHLNYIKRKIFLIFSSSYYFTLFLKYSRHTWTLFFYNLLIGGCEQFNTICMFFSVQFFISRSRIWLHY